jgi:hypothetical protein
MASASSHDDPWAVLIHSLTGLWAVESSLSSVIKMKVRMIFILIPPLLN